jgi:hypothetical protein
MIYIAVIYSFITVIDAVEDCTKFRHPGMCAPHPGNRE